MPSKYPSPFKGNIRISDMNIPVEDWEMIVATGDGGDMAKRLAQLERAMAETEAKEAAAKTKEASRLLEYASAVKNMGGPGRNSTKQIITFNDAEFERLLAEKTAARIRDSLGGSKWIKREIDGPEIVSFPTATILSTDKTYERLSEEFVVTHKFLCSKEEWENSNVQDMTGKNIRLEVGHYYNLGILANVVFRQPNQEIMSFGGSSGHIERIKGPQYKDYEVLIALIIPKEEGPKAGSMFYDTSKEQLHLYDGTKNVIAEQPKYSWPITVEEAADAVKVLVGISEADEMEAQLKQLKWELARMKPEPVRIPKLSWWKRLIAWLKGE